MKLYSIVFDKSVSELTKLVSTIPQLLKGIHKITEIEIPVSSFNGCDITAFRMRNGCTQEDLAWELGISKKTLSKWENNRTHLNKLEIIGIYMMMHDIEKRKTFIKDLT